MFYAGAALLAATAVLGVVFLIRRPVYRPEDAAAILDDGRTNPLRNAYPTDPLTVRQPAPGRAAAVETAVLEERRGEGTVPLGSGGAAPLPGADAPGTEVLPQPGEATVPLPAEQPGEATVPLAEGTAPLWEATIPLAGEATAPLVTEERP